MKSRGIGYVYKRQRLMSTMKEAAAGKLVRTLAAVRDAKEAA